MVGWLVMFHGMSTLTSYLMSNHDYSYILNTWFVNEEFVGNNFKRARIHLFV